jgi:ParB/RepB/Spo0J family partition protein
MSEQFAVMKRANVVRSTTNPRTYFDPAYIQELAISIKDHGVIQPILVRPLPGHRVADTPRGITHEIVCGECRDRGTELAGLDSYPVMIKDLSDDQVLEIQLVENLKRRDLTELEEALGYEKLMQHSSITTDEVGAKIGKSRSYVYGRLKLLDLCPEARISLAERTIDASVALVIARIPDSKLQIKALKEIIQGGEYWNGREPMSYRKALDHVQSSYMLKLNGASFKIDNADLVPDAGSCKTCSKRTGHNPDLFSDIKGADVCTDPPCFRAKEDAHTAMLVAAAQAKGQTVIAGAEAAELRGNSYQDKFKGYRRLDSTEDSPTDQPLRKIIGKQMLADGIKPVVIENPKKKGELVECLPNETVLKLLKAVEAQASSKQPVTKEVQKLVDDKKAKAEAKAKEQFEREWRANLLHDTWCEIRDDADIQAFTVDVHRYLVVRAAGSLGNDDAAAICKLLDLGKVSPIAAVVDFAKTTANPEMLSLLIIMQEASGPYDHAYYGRIANEGLMLVAKNAFGEQLEEVIKEIKAEVKAKIWPKVAKKASPNTAQAALQEGGSGGGSKARAPKRNLTAEEATLGIAHAMQGMEGAASAPVGAVALPQALDEEASLLARASQLVISTQKANLRQFKAELGIGQTKALELLDMLEKAGTISACGERGARKVLVAA